jgi:hypothetical protein
MRIRNLSSTVLIAAALASACGDSNSNRTDPAHRGNQQNSGNEGNGTATSDAGSPSEEPRAASTPPPPVPAADAAVPRASDASADP